jgi:aspartyl-tRNA(Asn)/glutamyl-tRNA(Gln) amidotransferase subunit A
MGRWTLDLSPVRMCLEAAGAISAADYLVIVKRRAEIITRFGHVRNFDAILLPTVMNAPPAISALDGDQDYLRHNSMSLRDTYMGNVLDCCVSIPANEPGAAPVGLMAHGSLGT